MIMTKIIWKTPYFGRTPIYIFHATGTTAKRWWNHLPDLMFAFAIYNNT
jgi:hypothetical protein